VGAPVAYGGLGGILGINPTGAAQQDAMLAVIEACMAIKAGLATTVALVYGNDQRSAAVQYSTRSSAEMTYSPTSMTWGFPSRRA